MSNGVSFVYFDIGGVVIKDFSKTNKWQELIDELMMPGDMRERFNELFDKFEDETNLGRNVEEFVPILRDKLGAKIPKGYSFLEAFVGRFNRNEGIEKILIEAKNKYNFGLLTNMYAGMLESIKEHALLPKIEWKIILDSSKIKCKKPEIKIYRLAERLAGVKPEEILFVDNKQENLETAIEMGWQTYFFDSRDYGKSNEELRLLLK